MESRPFFVPANTLNSDAEALYKELAALAGRSPLPINERIYSITYRHDGQEWVATVGETLRGSTIPDPKARSKKRQQSRPVSDPAVVWAIFPGAPYIVVTNHRLEPNTRSGWVNPFFAGQPTRVVRFSDTSQE